MTPEEFSNSFDTLLNSYSALINFNDGLVLDEYEKSIFLTEAQLQIVVELYSGRNDKGKSFELTEELRTYLRSLIYSAPLEEVIMIQPLPNAQFFKLPSDLLFIIYEEAIILDENSGCINGNTLSVTPISWDSLHKIKNNPFRQPNERRVLRLDYSSFVIKVLSLYHIGLYRIEYLIKPTPIVLADFDEVTVDGFKTITECKLDSSIHGLILERAVQLAIRSKGISDEK